MLITHHMMSELKKTMNINKHFYVPPQTHFPSSEFFPEVAHYIRVVFNNPMHDFVLLLHMDANINHTNSVL